MQDDKASVKFSHNWNHKLVCDYFTTIRAWTPEKEAYYRSLLQKKVRIQIKGVTQFFAEIRSVTVFRYSEVSTLVKILDTGSENYDEVFKQFNIVGDDKMNYLALKGKVSLQRQNDDKLIY